MTNTETPSAKLAAIERRILDAQHTLAFKAGLTDGHAHSSSEILRRYLLLKAMTEAEIAEAEAHGRTVSNLERDLLDWINALDLAA